MRKLLFILLIFSAKAFSKNLEQNTLDALEKTKVGKNLKKNIEKKIQNKVKGNELTLKAIAATKVIADKEFDVPINNRSSINLDYNNNSITYRYRFNF